MNHSHVLAASVLGILSLCDIAAAGERTGVIERGRYLVRITGCNDCHTPQYGPRGGEVPEQEWLIGDPVGWMGPWGPTYPTNLRQRIHGMSEAQWVQYAKTLKSRPPMPWFSLNAMSAEDLEAIWHFVRSLGDSANVVPAALPPGQLPGTPYMNVNVVLPKTAAARQVD